MQGGSEGCVVRAKFGLFCRVVDGSTSPGLACGPGCQLWCQPYWGSLGGRATSRSTQPQIRGGMLSGSLAGLPGRELSGAMAILAGRAAGNLDRILRILKNLEIPRERFHIHLDGALFAMMMPFVEFAPEISFKKPIDSIAVSGHKMLGAPMPCGIAFARKEHVKKVEQRIDYLNSVDTTIMGSRNGQAALYMWYSLRKKGIEGLKRDVNHCMETAHYLRDKLTDEGFTCRLNDLSSTVVLERPMDDAFIKRWQLACEEDIAHVVVMPNVTKDKINTFVEELIECKNKFGRMEPKREGSPLTQLTCSSWGGDGSHIPQVGDFKSA